MIHPRKSVKFNFTVCALSHLDPLNEHITGAKWFQFGCVAVIKEHNFYQTFKAPLKGNKTLIFFFTHVISHIRKVRLLEKQ